MVNDVNPNLNNYMPRNRKKTPPLCEVCGEPMLYPATCALCGGMFCRNKCGSIFILQHAQDQPWMNSFIGKNLCNKHNSNNRTASKDYIDKLFSDIFKTG